MFIKINLILSILFLSLNAIDLKITEKGIFSVKKNELISTNIKFDEAVYYSFYFKQFKTLGSFLFYETNSRFKQKCYIPIIYKNNDYFIKELTCFELSLNNGEKAFWSGHSILLKNNIELSKINIKKIINNFNYNLISKVTYSLGVFDENQQQLIFKNLNLKDDKLNIVSNNHKFKSKQEYEISSLNFYDLIISNDIFNLKKIELELKNNKNINTYNLLYFTKLVIKKEIKKNNLTNYNNIAYYLEQVKAYEESIFLLEKILEKYPQRTVAYLNIADAYWEYNEKEKAIVNYKVYVKQMKEKGIENKIPEKIFDRMKKKVSLKTILLNKQILFSKPSEKTKMYLIKGNKVEVLEEKDDWLYILYKGKKDIKAWIPKESIK